MPFYNYAVSPCVNTRDELAWRRRGGVDRVQPEQYEPIHMPSSTPIPAIIGIFAFGFGFGLVWRVWWMAAISLVAIIALVIFRSFERSPGYVLQPNEIEAMEQRVTASDIIAEQPTRPALLQAGAH